MFKENFIKLCNLENGKTVREYCKVCADAARADGYVSLQALNVVKPAPDTIRAILQDIVV